MSRSDRLPNLIAKRLAAAFVATIAIAVCAAGGLTSLSIATATPAAAQWFPEWDDFDRRPFWEDRRERRAWRREQRRREAREERRWQRERRRQQRAVERRQERQKKPVVQVASGGPKPQIRAVAPPIVRFESTYDVGTVLIDQSKRELYFTLSDTEAYRYPISVGREGFDWTGTEKVTRVAAWPSWHPPTEMRKREPHLPIKMLGGLKNPLGAKAIYLGSTLYRIHGTNNEKSIGRAASSGCFRMLNEHVMHLAELVSVGTVVRVMKSIPKPEYVAKAKTLRGADQRSSLGGPTER